MNEDDGLPIVSVSMTTGQVFVHDLPTERLLREVTETLRDVKQVVGTCCLPGDLYTRVIEALSKADLFLGRPLK